MKKCVLILLSIILLFSFLAARDYSDFSRSMKAINTVSMEKYAGVWYEYARLENRFEKGFINTQTEYSILEPDKKGRMRMQVENSGVKPNGKSSGVVGRAVVLFKDEPARFKLSFFGPFFSDYTIIGLDEENYQWALMAGGSKKLLWFFSRTPNMDPAVFNKLKAIAEGYGFNTSELIFPQK